MDIMPTVLGWVGADPGKLPASVEGGSWARLLKEAGRGTVERPVDGFVISFPHLIYGKGEIKEEVSAYVRYPHKVIYNWRQQKTELFDLEKDPGESQDLASQFPERAEGLKRDLLRYLDRHGEEVKLQDMEAFLKWEKTKVEIP
jgi:arylsulfatase A-like enzyme